MPDGSANGAQILYDSAGESSYTVLLRRGRADATLSTKAIFMLLGADEALRSGALRAATLRVPETVTRFYARGWVRVQ